MKVAIINCGSDKVHKNKCSAKELYTGSLFVASRKFCESNYDNYIILSAKYHCLFPDDEVSPYELYLGNLSAEQKKEWDIITANQIISKFPKGTELDFYTSKMYQKGIIPILEEEGFICNTYINNLSMGYKIQWFQHHTKQRNKKLF